jgi:hypothetical protein
LGSVGGWFKVDLCWSGERVRHVPVDISVLLQRYSQENSMDSLMELTLATRRMEMIITTTASKRMAIRIDFWRSGMGICQKVRTGIDITAYVGE